MRVSRTRYGRGGVVLGVFATLLMAGCGTPRLASAPLPAADLSGQWVLDPAASDDALRLITAALPLPKIRRPREDDVDGALLPSARDDGNGRTGRGGGRRGGSADGGRGEPQPPTRSAEVASSWGKLTPRDFVGAFVLPPERLSVVQQPSLMRVGAGDRPRAFEPGDEEAVTVNDRYGSRAVHAGWKADAFVITSQDGGRLDVVEQLRHNRDDRLERVVEFHARSVKSIHVRSVYRRATPLELQTGSVDGPPAPNR
ncbi:MAG: hypothetical protein NTZ79_16000 [Proteobacteria bacterium]|nr:hypothetical protein [Pseudomonadota bacterium]